MFEGHSVPDLALCALSFLVILSLIRWIAKNEAERVFTCCLKILSCSMIVLRTASLFSCLDISSIGSSKTCKSFWPLSFSNNWAIL
jgi:hypothetical protein